MRGGLVVILLMGCNPSVKEGEVLQYEVRALSTGKRYLVTDTVYKVSLDSVWYIEGGDTLGCNLYEYTFNKR